MQPESDSDKEAALKQGSTLTPPLKQTCIVITIMSLSFLSQASTLPRNENYISGLVAAVLFLGLILLTEYKGRKLLFIALFVISILSSTIYLMPELSESSKTAQETVRVATVVLIGVVLCEYCEPRHRLIHLITNSAILRVSYWVNFGSAIEYSDFGSYLEYFKILLGAVCLGSVLTWPESPYWLASKKRFEESKEAFLSLRGKNINSSEELQALTDAQPRRGSFKMIYAPLLMGLPVIMAIPLGIFTVEQYFYLDVTKNDLDQIWLYLLLNVITTVGYIVIALKLSRKRLILLPSVTFALCFIFTLTYNYLPIVSDDTDLLLSKVAFPFIHMVVTCAIASINYPIAIEIIPCKYSNALSAVMGLSYIFGANCFNYNVFGEYFTYFLIVCILAQPMIAYFLLPESKGVSMIEIERAYQPKQVRERTDL